MNGKKVDIILCTYNRAELLKQAVLSVARQTYKNWRLIIVNDGSTDNTRGVVKELERKKKLNIRYIEQKNKGLSAARNTGLEASDGNYIAFLDDDCEWAPEYLDKTVRILDETPANLAFAKAVYETGGILYGNKRRERIARKCILKKIGERSYILSNRIREEMKKECIFDPSQVVIKREFAEKTGKFDTRILNGEDYDYWLRSINYMNAGFVDENLVVCKVHKKNLSAPLIRADKQSLTAKSEYLKKQEKYLKMIARNSDYGKREYSAALNRLRLKRALTDIILGRYKDAKKALRKVKGGKQGMVGTAISIMTDLLPKTTRTVLGQAVKRKVEKDYVKIELKKHPVEKSVMFVNPDMIIGGGIQKISADLTRELSKKYSIHIFTFYDVKRKHTFVGKYKSLKQKPDLPKFVKLLRIIKRAHGIARYAKINNIDVIVASGGGAYTAAVLSKIFNKKLRVIAWVHNIPEKDLRELFYRTIAPLIYRKTDMIITVSRQIEDILRKKYSLQHVRTIYNGIEYDSIREKSRERLEEKYEKFFRNSFVFINIGRLEIQKGQYGLIRAFSKVRKKHKNAKLAILGGGGLQEELEELARRTKEEKNILFAGVHKNPYKFLKRSHCFVFPSLWEGFPVALIEAATLGLPLIATDCKSGPRGIIAPEIGINQKIKYPYFGRYGILTKPFSKRKIMKGIDEEPLTREEELLAEMMSLIIENKKLRDEYRRQRRGKDFDIKKIVKEWEEII